MPEKPNLPEDGSNLESQPTQPNLPPEIGDEQATRRQSSKYRTRNMPPVKDARLAPPPPSAAPIYGKGHGIPEKPKRGQPSPPQGMERKSRPESRRNRSPLSLPIWSVLLMLCMVCGTVSCIVLAVLGLGGRAAPALPPQFVVITAAPTSTLAITLPVLAPSPTSALLSQGQPDPLMLSGPTLPPVIISPTPESIGIGKTIVVDSQESGLNVRSVPGVFGTSVLFVADDGTQFTIVDGPAQGDGFTWWKIQDPADPTKSGWAAAVFLEIVPSATQVPQ